MNVGERAIQWLYEKQLQVDDKWSIPVEGGFKWWPGPFAQTVRIADYEVSPEGEVGYFLSCETEVLTALRTLDASPDGYLAQYMAAPSMCGPVFDPHKETLTLSSITLVHEQNDPWMTPLFSTACVLQICEALLLRPLLADELSALEAVSAHPRSGIRKDYDELAPEVETLIIREGRSAVCWSEADFAAAVEEHMQAPSIRAESNGLEIGIRIPCGQVFSQSQIIGNDPHPRYGNGLYAIEAYPFPMDSEAKGLVLALACNSEELTKRSESYGFGSYYYRQGSLYFSAFYPNAICKPGLLPTVFFSMANRAYDMSEQLFGGDRG